MTPDEELKEQDWIDRYLANRLSEMEQQAFKEKLLHDPSLAMKVDSTRKIVQTIQAANSEKRAQETLQKLYQRPIRVKQVPILYRWVGLVVTACLIGVVYLCNSIVELPLIEDDLLIVKNSDISHINADTSAYNLLLTGQRALQRKNYLQAASNMEAVLQNKDMRSYFREAAEWSLVVAYLYSDQPRRAELVYKRLQQIDNPEYEISIIEKSKMYIQIQLRKLR